jgi:hypothetical protein
LGAAVYITAMKLVNGVIAGLLILSGVLANTETLRFVYNLEETLSKTEIDISGRLSENNISLLKSVIPRPRGSESVQWIAVDGVDGQSYEVRVCWPASMPTSFDLEYHQGNLRIGYKTDYYSHLPELMDNPLPIEFEIVLNRLVLNALPRDIVETIGLTVVGGSLAYYYLSGLPFSNGLI